MNKKKLAWQLPFLAILIIGTIIILKKQAPFRTDEGFVFGTVYKITYQSEEECHNKKSAPANATHDNSACYGNCETVHSKTDGKEPYF
jgi:hypothetical protein